MQHTHPFCKRTNWPVAIRGGGCGVNGIAIIVLVDVTGTFYVSGSDLSLWPWLMVAVLIIVVMDYIKYMDYGFHDCEYGFWL